MKTALTAAVLAITLLAVLAREKHWDLFKAARAQTPEDGVYQMLDAARAGDTKAYLDCFSGEMRAQLAQAIKETSATQFSKYLLAQNSAFTGVALSVTENPTPNDARVRVEYVYAERNEVQDVYLRKDQGKWTIFKVAGSEQIKTLIPFGTRVAE
jgi:hypothetical protein